MSIQLSSPNIFVSIWIWSVSSMCVDVVWPGHHTESVYIFLIVVRTLATTWKHHMSYSVLMNIVSDRVIHILVRFVFIDQQNRQGRSTKAICYHGVMRRHGQLATDILASFTSFSSPTECPQHNRPSNQLNSCMHCWCHISVLLFVFLILQILKIRTILLYIYMLSQITDGLGYCSATVLYIYNIFTK